MKSLKIGLVLGGGGTKGAYQLGVLLAIKRHGLLPYIITASANSIGSLNLLLLLNQSLEHGIDIWKSVNKDTLFSKKSIKDIFKNLTKFSIFSRSGLVDLLEKHIDFNKVSSTSIISYVAATKVKNNHPTYFQINQKSKFEIINYVLASSAIPYIYEPVLIEDELYVDGYKFANEPFEPILNSKLDFIFFIPLNHKYEIKDSYKICPIVDFCSDIFKDTPASESLNVTDFVIQERLSCGYQLADELITRLRKEGIICLKFREKLHRFLKRIIGKKVKYKSIYRYDD